MILDVPQLEVVEEVQMDNLVGSQLSQGEVALVEVAALRAVQPFIDKLTELTRNLSALEQRVSDAEQDKEDKRQRVNFWLKIIMPIVSALVIAFGVWVWNQHTATVELRVAVSQNVSAIATLTETVSGVNRRVNSQGGNFTSLKTSVDDMLKAHRALLHKASVMPVEPPARRRMQRPLRR